MSCITDIIESTIGKEGRYSNNPNDSGGETMWGVTKAVAREQGYAGPMIDLPRERAVEMFTRAYFVTPGFDRVLLRSSSIAEELFDTGVNMGQGTACKFLQRALNLFNLGGAAYPDTVVDGSIGTKTLTALDLYLAKRKSEGELVLLRVLNSFQGEKCAQLAEARVKDETFVYGWFLNRVVI